MREVFFPGADGRIEGRYIEATHNKERAALVLHSHPINGGSLNDQIVKELCYRFISNDFSVLCTNFRGVGKSGGVFDDDNNQVIDSSLAVDWLMHMHQDTKIAYVAGVDFGSWVAMQLVMRRPEITNFISVSTPCTKYDFSFLSPCPASGLFIHGDNDSVIPLAAAQDFVDKIIKRQQGGKIHQEVNFCEIQGGDHFFRDKMQEFGQVVNEYINGQLHNARQHKRSTNSKFQSK